ncbi:MAG: glycosyltransferase [Chloroflexi bacterium]|nr:glycosyltransferase [Chloroflexota bacterium]
MRILFLTPLFPYPPGSGGLIKTGTLLDFLARGHELDVLCFQKGDLSPEQGAFAEQFPGRIEPLPLDRRRTLANLLRSYAAGVPLSLYRNYNRQMADLVHSRLSDERNDALFVDHWLMAQYLPPEFEGLTLLHLHNAEHLIWQRQAAATANLLLRLIAQTEAARIRRYEAAIVHRFRRVFAVSEADRRAFLALGAPAERLQVLPNVAEPRLLQLPPLRFDEAPPNVLYVGTLSWQPNVEGLREFVRSAFPAFRRRLPQSVIIVAGSGPPRWLRRLAGREAAVELVTPVTDAESLYNRARVFLEPVRGGAGSKVKVLNALARGLPVVTTPDGAEGIEAGHAEHLLVANDPVAMLDAAQDLLNDEALWQRLSDGGRALVRERYVPEVSYRPLEQVLSAVG